MFIYNISCSNKHTDLEPRHGWAPDPPMVGIRSPIGLVVGSCNLEFWVRFPNERNQGKQAHPVIKYRVPHGSHFHAAGRRKESGAATPTRWVAGRLYLSILPAGTRDTLTETHTHGFGLVAICGTLGAVVDAKRDIRRVTADSY